MFLLHGKDNWERWIMKHRSVDRDILVVIILSIIALVLAFIAPADWLPFRILTLPLVLLLPGYALTSALLPRQTLGIAERLLLSLGLSLTIVILGGLVLNQTPFGLAKSSWAVLLTGITLSACIVAFIRRQGETISTAGWIGVGGIGLTSRQGLLLSMAGFIVCAAIAMSIVGAEQQ